MNKTEYYYKDDDDKKIFLSDSQLRNAYFQGGYQNPKDKGVLSTLYFGKHGTTLCPVLKDGEYITLPEYAGKDVHETTFLTQ